MISWGVFFAVFGGLVVWIASSNKSPDDKNAADIMAGGGWISVLIGLALLAGGVVGTLING